MGIQNEIEKAGAHVKEAGEHLLEAGAKAGEKVKHVVSEQLHNTTAEAERKRRETFGDEMTPAEKAKSVANEAKNTVQGGVDGIKKRLDDAR